MIPLSSLHNSHADRPAAILGGGPSLPGDMARLPHPPLNAKPLGEGREGVLLIAVNDHAIHIGVEPDYMVFMDDPIIKPELMRIVTTWCRGRRVTETLQYTDVDLRGVVRPDARSGIWSVWFAMYLGCAPIILCGMDLYTTGNVYCHDKDDWMVDKPAFNDPLEKHIKDWRTLEKYPAHKHIRAMSGPLVEIFGVYPPLPLGEGQG